MRLISLLETTSRPFVWQLVLCVFVCLFCAICVLILSQAPAALWMGVLYPPSPALGCMLSV